MKLKYVYNSKKNIAYIQCHHVKFMFCRFLAFELANLTQTDSDYWPWIESDVVALIPTLKLVSLFGPNIRSRPSFTSTAVASVSCILSYPG